MGVETALTITLKGKDVTGGAFAGVGKQLQKLNRETRGWRGSLDAANRSLVGLGRQADIAAARWSGLTAAARSAGMAMTAVGLASVAALGAAVKAAIGFDEGMRNVNSIMQLTESGFADLENQVKAIASDPMVIDMPTVLAEGLYDIVSSGLQGQVAMDTLQVASQGAAAGLSTTATAANVLASVMNAYNAKTGADAAAIMDVLFKTVDRGVVTFDELAQSFAFASTTAAAAGVPLADVAAGMMTMTKQGHNAAIASTSLARVVTAFLNPSKELTAALQANGYASGLQVLRTWGLSGAVEFLSQTYGDNIDQMVAVLGEMRAVRAAMAMTGKGAEMYAEDLAAAGNATGATAKALEQQAKGAAFQWKELKKQFALMAIEAGEDLLPALKEIGEDLRPLVKLAAEFVKERPNFAKWAAGFGLMNLALGPLLMNLTNLIRLTTMAKGAWGLLAGSQGIKAVVTWGGRILGRDIGRAAVTAMGDQGPLIGEAIAKSAARSPAWGIAGGIIAGAVREAIVAGWISGKLMEDLSKAKTPAEAVGATGKWAGISALLGGPISMLVGSTLSLWKLLRGKDGADAFAGATATGELVTPTGAGASTLSVGKAAAEKMPEEVRKGWEDYFRLAQQHLDWRELMAPGEWSAARDQVIIGMNKYADELVRLAEFESDEAKKRAMLMEANDKRIAAIRLAKEEGPDIARWQEHLGYLENRSIWAKQRGGIGIAQAQEDLVRGQYKYSQALAAKGDILGSQAAWRDAARSEEERVGFWKDAQMNVNVYVGNEPVDARIEKNLAGARYARTPA